MYKISKYKFFVTFHPVMEKVPTLRHVTYMDRTHAYNK